MISCHINNGFNIEDFFHYLIIHYRNIGHIIAITRIDLHSSLAEIHLNDIASGTYKILLYLVTFMKTIPKELEEAAEIDGCGRFRNFFMIVLPLSKPGLATLAIYNGVAMWNEFAFANTLLQSPANKTLPLALGQFKGEHALDIPIILSVLTLSVLPMIILFIIFQNKLVKGMMAGAVKG